MVDTNTSTNNPEKVTVNTHKTPQIINRVEISERSIIFAIVFPLVLGFFWLIRELLFSLVIAFILMSALRPITQFLIDRKWPRQVAIFTVFFTFLLGLIGLVVSIIPPIVTESTAFIRNFPLIAKQINPVLAQFIDVNSLSQVLPNVTNNVFTLIGNLFSNFFFVITTLFFALYFLLEGNVVRLLLKPYVTKEQLEYFERVASHVESRLTSWFWGQFTLMVVIGVLTFIALSVEGIRYALPLAVLAGLLEVVPNIGPVLSSIPAIIIGLSDSTLTGLIVVLTYFVIQQAENAFIVPLIMRRAVGINPILTLTALIIGGKIGGVLGVLLAIPLILVGESVAAELIAAYQANRKKGEIKVLE